MSGPFQFYIDIIDTAAFQKAESRNRIGQYDSPIAPLLAPWVVGGPFFIWLPPPSPFDKLLFAAAATASIVGYAAAMVFYYRRVIKYRRDLGIEKADLI